MSGVHQSNAIFTPTIKRGHWTLLRLLVVSPSDPSHPPAIYLSTSPSPTLPTSVSHHYSLVNTLSTPLLSLSLQRKDEERCSLQMGLLPRLLLTGSGGARGSPAAGPRGSGRPTGPSAVHIRGLGGGCW